MKNGTQRFWIMLKQNLIGATLENEGFVCGGIHDGRWQHETSITKGQGAAKALGVSVHLLFCHKNHVLMSYRTNVRVKKQNWCCAWWPSWIPVPFTVYYAISLNSLTTKKNPNCDSPLFHIKQNQLFPHIKISQKVGGHLGFLEFEQ